MYLYKKVVAKAGTFTRTQEVNIIILYISTHAKKGFQNLISVIYLPMLEQPTENKITHDRFNGAYFTTFYS